MMTKDNTRDWRNGGHLDPYTNPMMGPQLQATTLRRLRDKIGQESIVMIRDKIETYLCKQACETNGINFIIRDFRFNFSEYICTMTQALTHLPVRLDFTLDRERGPEFHGINISELIKKPASRIVEHKDLIPIWLLMTYRAIVQGSASYFPGLGFNISPAGLHLMLASLGVDVYGSGDES